MLVCKMQDTARVISFKFAVNYIYPCFFKFVDTSVRWDVALILCK